MRSPARQRDGRLSSVEAEADQESSYDSGCIRPQRPACALCSTASQLPILRSTRQLRTRRRATSFGMKTAVI